MMQEDIAFLRSLEKQLKEHKEVLKEASEAVLNDEVTNFPIFVFHKIPFPIGESLIKNLEGEAFEWNVTMVSLEQLIQIGLIPVEKAKLFIASYKNPLKFMCVLAIENPDKTSFVYYPY